MNILPKEGWIRRKAESWLILLAAKILEGRNVNRAMVVSRRDNNDMAYMAEKLEAIAERIDEGYREVRNG